MSMLDRRTLMQGTTLAALIATLPAQAADGGLLYVIAEIVAKPDKADDLRKLLVPFVASSRKEPGCKSYALLEVQGEPGRFLTFESWADKPSLDAHMVTPQMKEIAPKLGDLLGKPFTQIFMNAVSL